MSRIRWTEDKLKPIREKYPSGNKKALAEELGISYRNLTEVASRYGIKSKKPYFGSFAKLIEENNTSYYWHGFLMGDGTMGKHKQIVVTLSIKDKGHLQKLADFLGGEIKTLFKKGGFGIGMTEFCRFTRGDKSSGEILSEKYKWKTNKTENPPDLSCLDSKEKFLSFFAGFVDADGSVAEENGHASRISIELHKSWFDNLLFFKKGLELFLNIDSRVSINKRGFCQILIYGSLKVIKIKKEIQLLNLPLMERKWDKIDINFIPKKIKTNLSLDKIESFLKEGLSWKEIVKNLNLKSVRRCREKYYALKGIKYSYSFKELSPTGMATPHKYQKVNQIDIESGKIIKTWKSAYDAAEHLFGIRKRASGILEAIQKKTKEGERRTCIGYFWEFVA